ncbi:MAG: (Fe-S)-binding protein [Anaerolineae bacterium]|jgi:heterodisulfide reductase subunit C
MLDSTQRLVDRYGLSLCVECGKCVAACPMREILDGFSSEHSARGVVRRALLGLEMVGHAGIWLCLTCDLCTNLCPAGVRFRDFIRAARRLSVETGRAKYGSFCRGCSAHICPSYAVEYLKRTLGEASQELLTLCPRCRQYRVGRRVKGLAVGSRRKAVQ